MAQIIYTRLQASQAGLLRALDTTPRASASCEGMAQISRSEVLYMDLLRKRPPVWDVFANPIRQPHLSKMQSPLHATCLIVYILLLSSMSAILLINYVQRPEVETTHLQPITLISAIDLQLRLQCSVPWACHGGPKPWRDTVWMNTSYSIAASASCADRHRNDTQISGQGIPLYSHDANVSLCTSSANRDGIYLTVSDFSGNCSYGDQGCNVWFNVQLLAQGAHGSPALELAVELEPSQRKAVYIGAIVRRRLVGSWMPWEPEQVVSENVEPFVDDLFYVGKNVRSEAMLHIATSQTALLVTVSRSGTLAAAFGEIGGVNGLLIALLGIVLLLIKWALPLESMQSGEPTTETKLTL